MGMCTLTVYEDAVNKKVEAHAGGTSGTDHPVFFWVIDRAPALRKAVDYQTFFRLLNLRTVP